jgi:hypothetical protein
MRASPQIQNDEIIILRLLRIFLPAPNLKYLLHLCQGKYFKLGGMLSSG